MRKRSDRMQRICELARTEERSECEAMGRVQRSLDSELTRLNELESYRRDYQTRFSHPGTVSPSRWQDYQSFLQRLDSAVRSQKEQILAGKETRDAHRRRWLVKRQKLQSLERVVSRYRKVETTATERRQQKALDELTSANQFSRLKMGE